MKSNKKINILNRYPFWLLRDIEKMAKRVGPQAYSLVTTKYGISLEEINTIVKQADSINGRTSASKPESVGSNPALPAKCVKCTNGESVRKQ